MSVQASADTSAESAREETVRVIGFGMRLVATLLDAFFVGAISLMVAFLIGFFAVFVDIFRDPESTSALLIVPLSGFIFSAAYYVVAWKNSGTTIAKFIFGQKVISSDGKDLTWGKAVRRYIGYIVSLVALSIGFLWIAFDGKRQGWHDKIAGTYVVDVEDDFFDSDAVNLIPRDAGSGWFWLIVWIIVAVGVPGGLVAGLLVLGPTMANFIYNTAKDLIG
jgi:uncharacterized RDD family membrane protein YckC